MLDDDVLLFGFCVHAFGSGLRVEVMLSTYNIFHALFGRDYTAPIHMLFDVFTNSQFVIVFVPN